MSAPLRLIPHAPSRELVEVLTALLDAAEDGSLTGLVFGCSFMGNKVCCDAAGALDRDPVMGLGVVSMLRAELEQRVMADADDAPELRP